MKIQALLLPMAIGILLGAAPTYDTPEMSSAMACNLFIATGGQFCSASTGHHSSRGPGGEFGGQNHGGACFVCSQGGNPVEPENCHSCTGIEGGSDVGAEEEAYDSLLAAAAADDIDQVLQLAPKVASRVSVNLMRSSVQIASCDGKTLIANIPIGQNQLAALHQALMGSSAADQ
ncbi:MAG: hypothetical protein ACRENP_00455 [Longimicrobiales bacterium]